MSGDWSKPFARLPQKRRRVGGEMATNKGLAWLAQLHPLPSRHYYNEQLNCFSIAPPRAYSTCSDFERFPHSIATQKMSAHPDNEQMEGVHEQTADIKGKGKAPEGDTMEESMDDDSSDESGIEDHVRALVEPFVLAQTANSITLGRRRYCKLSARAPVAMELI